MKSEQPIKRVLIVGAGAVGQVYARHLQAAGIQVDLFVKEAYAESCRAGLHVFPLNDKVLRVPGVLLKGFHVFSSAAELKDIDYDQVWLCVSSPALRGPWLSELLSAASPRTLVSLTPGFKDKKLLESVFEGPLVLGLIHFISYQSPLPLPAGWSSSALMDKEALRPCAGVAYWFPPAAKGPFGGEEQSAKRCVAALLAGGFPAKYDADTRAKASFGSALLIPLMVALERADWRFRALMKGDTLSVALRASKEAQHAMSAALGVKAPFWRHLVGGWTLRAGLGVSRKVIPFDLEVYLAYHFQKVRDQTVQMIDASLALARADGVEAPALAELARLLNEPPVTSDD